MNSSHVTSAAQPGSRTDAGGTTVDHRRGHQHLFRPENIRGGREEQAMTSPAFCCQAARAGHPPTRPPRPPIDLASSFFGVAEHVRACLRVRATRTKACASAESTARRRLSALFGDINIDASLFATRLLLFNHIHPDLPGGPLHPCIPCSHSTSIPDSASNISRQTPGQRVLF